MTKSPIALAKAALAAGQEALDDYSHPNSPHTFTQPQHFAISVLRQFFGVGFAAMEQYLIDLGDLRRALGLRSVPEASTIHRAEQRILKKGALPESLTPWLTRPETRV